MCRTKNQRQWYLHSIHIRAQQACIFAIDNVDLAFDTPDRKGQLHGTGTVVNQEVGEGRAVSYFFFFSIKLEMPLEID